MPLQDANPTPSFGGFGISYSGTTAGTDTIRAWTGGGGGGGGGGGFPTFADAPVELRDEVTKEWVAAAPVPEPVPPP